MMAVPSTQNDFNGSQLSQSMNSNTDIVRIDDGSSVGGGTNTSMASIGMAGVTDSQRSMVNIDDDASDEEDDSNQQESVNDKYTA